MQQSSNNSRRSFIRSAAGKAAVAAIAPSAFAMAETTSSASSTSRIIGANDRIRIAVLGINGRGKTHVEEIMDLASKSNVEVVALCDPDMNLLKVAAADFEKKYGKKVAIEQDFRKIYDDMHCKPSGPVRQERMYMLKSPPRTTSTRARR